MLVAFSHDLVPRGHLRDLSRPFSGAYCKAQKQEITLLPGKEPLQQQCPKHVFRSHPQING